MEIEKKARIAKAVYEAAVGGAPDGATRVDKRDAVFRNGGRDLRLRKIGVGTTYELSRKEKVFMNGGESNREIETRMEIADVDSFVDILEGTGVGLVYMKRKEGVSYYVSRSYEGHAYSLHVEVVNVSSGNGYSDYFVEIEYTGDCDVELSAEYVLGEIDGLIGGFEGAMVEPRPYIALILGEASCRL